MVNPLHGGNELRPSLHGDALPSVSSGRPVGGAVRRYELALAAGVYGSVPGNPELGGGALIITPGATGNATNFNSLDQVVFPTGLPLAQKTSGLGPVRAIAIAPDSPIDSCDLWLGDFRSTSRIRVSKEHPFIGDITEVEFAVVTLPEALGCPFDADDEAAELAADWVLRNHVWDAQVNGALSAVGARVDMAFPLRLDVYRGEVLPLPSQRRAPYLADFGTDNRNAGGGVLTYGRLWTCVQGRAVHQVTVGNTSVAATSTEDIKVTITGYRPCPKRRGAAPTPLLRMLVPTQLDQFNLQADEYVNLTYRDPYQWLAVRIEAGGSSATDFHGTAHIRSEDG